MNVYYICTASPECIRKKRNQGIAGGKFSIQLAKALDKEFGGNLKFVSMSSMTNSDYEECGGEIWDGKKFKLIRYSGKPGLSELIQGIRFFLWMAKNRKNKPVIVIESIYCFLSIACALLKLLFKIPCYCILIDKPTILYNKPKTFLKKIIYWQFLTGQKMLHHYCGIITFTKKALTEWSLEKMPFCNLCIGCSEEQIQESIEYEDLKVEKPKTAVFAGTLIKYNCTEELIEAFGILGNEYELHIYGYGPLQAVAEKKSHEFDNVFFHGRFNPEDTFRILKKYDLLINSRKIDKNIENFTFPSKIIDYFLTKRTVLSTAFKTMPEEYKKFVFLINDTSPKEIAGAVKNALDLPISEREKKANMGYDYIINKQTYNQNAKNIASFLKETSGNRLM